MSYRWAEPENVEAPKCHCCGATCTIERNVLGYTCFASAMAKKKKLHDAIRCPNEGKDWHRRARELQTAMVFMPSPRVRNLMEQDLAELLAAYAPSPP